ncbi:MAG: RES family NAD+ phosphorylase [Candidatus Nealsonbacteria bacterium]|nr:RES family NAD+ phosphorylase [Candidatus Nealsonbacteria bacterium]
MPRIPRVDPVSDWARGRGYDGILAPSARNPGGSNLVVFKGL